MIAASLWAQPATLDELSEREFLKTTSIYGIDRMLFIMENDGWIYFITRNDGVFRFQDLVTDVEEVIDVSVPRESIALAQNSPNPFGASTSIQYHIPKSTRVILKIYNASGEEIETLVNHYKLSGTHEIYWDASDVSNGLYHIVLAAAGQTVVRKAVINKTR